METTSAAAPQTATGGRRHGSGDSGGDRPAHPSQVDCRIRDRQLRDRRPAPRAGSGLQRLAAAGREQRRLAADRGRSHQAGRSCVAHSDWRKCSWSKPGFRGAWSTWRNTGAWSAIWGNLIEQMKRVNGSLKEHHDIPRSLGPTLVDLIVRHDLDFRSHFCVSRRNDARRAVPAVWSFSRTANRDSLGGRARGGVYAAMSRNHPLLAQSGPHDEIVERQLPTC